MLRLSKQNKFLWTRQISLHKNNSCTLHKNVLDINFKYASFQAFFSDINPFIYGEQDEPPVQSSVAQFGLFSCSSKVEAKGNDSTDVSDKGVEDGPLTPSVSFGVTLKPQAITKPDCTNSTPKDTFGMIYHGLEISNPPMPVQISIYPRQDEILEVYISANRLPNPANYMWNFTIPKGSLDYVYPEPVILEDGTTVDPPLAEFDETDLTIVISAENVEFALNSSWYNITESNDTNKAQNSSSDAETATQVPSIFTTLADIFTTTFSVDTSGNISQDTETTLNGDTWQDLNNTIVHNRTLFIAIRHHGMYNN